MIGTFLLKNIEIVAALVSFGGMGLYLLTKDKKVEDNSNDLTEIILEHKKTQKSISDKVDGGIFGLNSKR